MTKEFMLMLMTSQRMTGEEDMRSYLPCLHLCVSAVRARPVGHYHCNFILGFCSNVWVCLKGIRLVDPSLFFLRDPKAHHAEVGAQLLKEELVVGLVMTSELWLCPAISRAEYDRLGIHQHTSHRLKFDGTMVNALGSRLHTTSLVGCLSLVGV